MGEIEKSIRVLNGVDGCRWCPIVGVERASLVAHPKDVGRSDLDSACILVQIGVFDLVFREFSMLPHFCRMSRILACLV